MPAEALKDDMFAAVDRFKLAIKNAQAAFNIEVDEIIERHKDVPEDLQTAIAAMANRRMESEE